MEGSVPPALPSVETLRNDLPLRLNEPITKAAFETSRDLLLLVLQGAGYARAKAHPRTEVDRKTHEAFVTYTLEPGARTAFGEVTVTGAENIRPEAIRRRLTFHSRMRSAAPAT